MIRKEDIDNLVLSSNIEDVVSEFVDIKKKGSNSVGLCPFHEEKTASFVVSNHKGIYKCFGCGEGGGVINFLMASGHSKRGMGYKDAVYWLADYLQIEIKEDSEKPKHEYLYEEMSQWNRYFCKNLSPISRGILNKRGITDKDIQKWNIGFCDTKFKSFFPSGTSRRVSTLCGLIHDSGTNPFNLMTNRITFPIKDSRGYFIGFGGRSIRKDPKTKYINNKNSLVYNKSRALYGIFNAKYSIMQEGFTFAVEGYTDVISMHSSGFTNTIGTCGTSFTQSHFSVIQYYCKKVVLVFDGDSAGIKAAHKALDNSLEFKGLVKVLVLPSGYDPDSYLHEKGPESFSRLISSAMDAIQFKSSFIDKQGDDLFEELQKIIKDISKIRNPIRQKIQIISVCKSFGLSEKDVYWQIKKLRKTR